MSFKNVDVSWVCVSVKEDQSVCVCVGDEGSGGKRGNGGKMKRRFDEMEKTGVKESGTVGSLYAYFYVCMIVC